METLTPLLLGIPRMSPNRITDDLDRVDLYKEIRDGQNRVDWPQRVIFQDEVRNPELTAFRFYGSDQMKWVVLVASGLDDMREEMVAGTVLRLPPASWIRERIRKMGVDPRPIPDAE